ncbi:MAG: sugar phosphate isomerase family [Acidobacteriaceae bacterium]
MPFSNDFIDPGQLLEWCKIPADKLPNHPDLRVPYREVRDSEEMGRLMAEELAEVIAKNNEKGVATRAIIPCGPKCWYAPFANLVNTRRLSLRNVEVFHMDECLTWQGQLLPANHPYNFRTFMEKHFYGDILPELAVPTKQRRWLSPATMESVKLAVDAAPVDITVGGWGQDGHIAYNQAKRHPFHRPTIDEIADSTIRIQDNNVDTIVSLSQRTFGAAYQFVPPMSITLGLRECLSAKKVRVYSDTGSWKQTALRVALFSPPVSEYPITLLQRHPDAIITATRETARHPISENPDWELL